MSECQDKGVKSVTESFQKEALTYKLTEIFKSISGHIYRNGCVLVSCFGQKGSQLMMACCKKV